MKIFPFPSMLVGMTRFELATSGPPDRCATGLRHIPSSECACKKKLALRVWLAAIPPLSSKPRASRMFFQRIYCFRNSSFQGSNVLARRNSLREFGLPPFLLYPRSHELLGCFQRIYCFRNSSFQGFAIVRFISSNLCERF